MKQLIYLLTIAFCSLLLSNDTHYPKIVICTGEAKAPVPFTENLKKADEVILDHCRINKLNALVSIMVSDRFIKPLNKNSSINDLIDNLSVYREVTVSLYRKNKTIAVNTNDTEVAKDFTNIIFTPDSSENPLELININAKNKRLSDLIRNFSRLTKVNIHYNDEKKHKIGLMIYRDAYLSEILSDICRFYNIKAEFNGEEWFLKD